MATKKTTTKKAPAKKKPAVKTSKTAVKKVNKPTRAKSSSASRVLALQREQEDFMNFRVNRETVYWAVLGAVVILFALWIMQLQSDIQKLYDEVDASTAAANAVDISTVKKN